MQPPALSVLLRLPAVDAVVYRPFPLKHPAAAAAAAVAHRLGGGWRLHENLLVLREARQRLDRLADIRVTALLGHEQLVVLRVLLSDAGRVL